MRQTSFHRCSWLFALAAVVLFSALPVHASIIISIVSVTEASGSTGDSFDVDIQNTGAAAQSLDAFSLGLSVASSNIIFTGGNTSTSLAYVYSGNSFDVINGFPYTAVPPPNGQTLEGSDSPNLLPGSIAGSTTVGLGHILFNVAPGTPAGPITVSIVPDCSTVNACTSLSDANFNSIPFSVANGTITVTTTSSPEPSTLLLALFAVPAIVLRRRKR